MDKKVLKMYAAPAVESVELELEGQLLDGSDTNVPGTSAEEMDEE